VLHYRNRIFCRVSNGYFTLDKSLPSVTLDKKHSANILSAKGSLSSTFFGHSAKTLPSVEKQSAKKSTRQIKNYKKPQKTAKHFLN
jgi:hypothetical protein